MLRLPFMPCHLIRAGEGSAASAPADFHLGLARLTAEINQGSTLLQEMRDRLWELTRAKQQDTPDYQDLNAAIKQLEQSIQVARQVQDQHGVGSAPPPKPKSLPDGPPPFAAEIGKFRSTLGPSAARGATNAGLEVMNLQKMLCWLGFEVPVDGRFTDKPRSAVAEWQKQQGIRPADGNVGASTRQALNLLLAGRGEPAGE